jgi:diguanylate cyclase (GGDEF)-like protein
MGSQRAAAEGPVPLTPDELALLQRARDAFRSAMPREKVVVEEDEPVEIPIPEVSLHHTPSTAPIVEAVAPRASAEVADILLDSFGAADGPVGVFTWPGATPVWENEALAKRPNGGAERTLLSMLDEWSQAHFLVRALPDLLRGGQWQGRLCFVDEDAQSALELATTLVAHRDQEGTIDAVSLVAHPIVEVGAAVVPAPVGDDGSVDDLTGLPDRSRLRRELEALATGGATHHLAMLLVDFDRFRQVNEEHGARATDGVLQTLAHRLRDAVTDDCLVARLRSDEFAVLVPGVGDEHAARQVADRLRAAVSESVFVGAHSVQVTASVGIALADTGDDEAELVARADRALRAAKDGGRDRTMVYDGTLAKGEERRRSIDLQLRRALATGGLQMRYQPVVELATDQIVGVEGLLRVRGDTGELLSPGAFVAAAESTGLITRLGGLVLLASCEQIHELGDAFAGVEISVNVSPRQVADREFASTVEHALEETGITPARLSLEITEGAFLGRDDASETNIGRLRDQGVRVGLDEFGGDASLGYLRRFPLDFVKIDRSLIAGLGANYVDGAIVRSVLDLARKLGLTTTAVGVETEEQETRLREMGCDRGQGYLFAGPVAIDDLPPLLAV